MVLVILNDPKLTANAPPPLHAALNVGLYMLPSLNASDFEGSRGNTFWLFFTNHFVKIGAVKHALNAQLLIFY